MQVGLDYGDDREASLSACVSYAWEVHGVARRSTVKASLVDLVYLYSTLYSDPSLPLNAQLT